MFDWDEANIAHIAVHDVSVGEAEEVVSNRLWISANKPATARNV
jgi:hypothetical protein